MKKVILLTRSLCVFSLGFSSLTLANNIPSIPVLQTEMAQTIAETAYKNCADQGGTPSVSVVDQQGTLLYFRRGEGVGPHSVTTSFRKAYSAASLKMPTSALATYVDMPKYSQLAKMSDDILLLTGGLPISYKGNVIGGIGLSGLPSPEMEEKCGADALASVFK